MLAKAEGLSSRASRRKRTESYKLATFQSVMNLKAIGEEGEGYFIEGFLIYLRLPAS